MDSTNFSLNSFNRTHGDNYNIFQDTTPEINISIALQDNLDECPKDQSQSSTRLSANGPVRYVKIKDIPNIFKNLKSEYVETKINQGVGLKYFKIILENVYGPQCIKLSDKYYRRERTNSINLDNSEELLKFLNGPNNRIEVYKHWRELDTLKLFSSEHKYNSQAKVFLQSEGHIPEGLNLELSALLEDPALKSKVIDFLKRTNEKFQKKHFLQLDYPFGKLLEQDRSKSKTDSSKYFHIRWKQYLAILCTVELPFPPVFIVGMVGSIVCLPPGIGLACGILGVPILCLLGFGAVMLLNLLFIKHHSDLERKYIMLSKCFLNDLANIFTHTSENKTSVVPVLGEKEIYFYLDTTVYANADILKLRKNFCNDCCLSLFNLQFGISTQPVFDITHIKSSVDTLLNDFIGENISLTSETILHKLYEGLQLLDKYVDVTHTDKFDLWNAKQIIDNLKDAYLNFEIPLGLPEGSCVEP